MQFKNLLKKNSYFIVKYLTKMEELNEYKYEFLVINFLISFDNFEKKS